MVKAVHSGLAASFQAAQAQAAKNAKAVKLSLDSVPTSKVKVEALHTTSGKGLKIDIKV